MTHEDKELCGDLLQCAVFLSAAVWPGVPKWCAIILSVFFGYALSTALQDYKEALEKRIKELGDKTSCD